VNAQPTQVLDHGVNKFRTRSLRVQVLISQNQGALVVKSALGGDQKSAGMPQVQQACG
jgi:hypothetical protein